MSGQTGEKDQTAVCQWCYSVVWDYGQHIEWHRQYDLHGLGCDVPRVQKAQRGTGAYIVPKPCSCGLSNPPGSAAAHE